MTLDDWALATITGVGGEKYIQDQAMTSVSQMTKHRHPLAVHHDTKGKTWSNLRLFRQGDGFVRLERRSPRGAQPTELEKYTIFSKMAVAPDDERVLLGVAGSQARVVLTDLFSELPNSDKQVITENASTVLWFEHLAKRLLLVVDATTTETLVGKPRGEAELNNSQQWLALDIEVGIPVIDTANSIQFISRATNLQALGRTSFKKSCYTDQKMAARVKFREVNGHAMWTLVGATGRVPEAGEDLELKMGKNWRRTDTVLATVQLADGQVLVQAVMNNDMEVDSVFRVRDDAKTLCIVPLPYPLDEE